MRSGPPSRSRYSPGWSFRPSASARESEPMNTDFQGRIDGGHGSRVPSLRSGPGTTASDVFPLIARDEARGEPAQAIQVDAARAHDVAHREIDRLKRHVLGKALIPARAQI